MIKKAHGKGRWAGTKRGPHLNGQSFNPWGQLSSKRVFDFLNLFGKKCWKFTNRKDFSSSSSSSSRWNCWILLGHISQMWCSCSNVNINEKKSWWGGCAEHFFGELTRRPLKKSHESTWPNNWLVSCRRAIDHVGRGRSLIIYPSVSAYARLWSHVALRPLQDPERTVMSAFFTERRRWCVKVPPYITRKILPMFEYKVK